jgi:hypothetical protein
MNLDDYLHVPPKKSGPALPTTIPPCVVCGVGAFAADRIYEPRFGWVHRERCLEAAWKTP